MTATIDPYQAAQDSAARLAELTGQPRHDAVVVLGSGWAPAADALGAVDAEVPLAELGGFPLPGVGGHSPVVRSVRAGPVRALVFLGRVHLYEGHDVATVVHSVRTAVAADCQVVVLTNAAGGIREGYQVGQPVLIRDHLNLTGRSPLSGSPPPPGYPSRFVDLTDLYSAMLRTLAADLVGMSTVLEAIAARHLGAEVLAISLVSNLAAGLAPHGLDHAEVVAAGKAAAGRMGSLLAGLLPVIVP